VYALSFYITSEEDDGRRITVTLGYNTYHQWRASENIASSSQEAQWNYAFWIQNQEAIIGSSYEPIDQTGIELRQEWLKQKGLWYSDEEEKDDFDRILELSDEIEQQFIQICIQVAQKLHDTNIITSSFKRHIPIIVHDLEYDDVIAIQTRKANPPGVAQEFENWIMSMYEGN
jgi:hypothetical protein